MDDYFIDQFILINPGQDDGDEGAGSSPSRSTNKFNKFWWNLSTHTAKKKKLIQAKMTVMEVRFESLTLYFGEDAVSFNPSVLQSTSVT